MECQLRQVTGVCIAGCQPGRGLTIIQVCEVKWFVQQPLSAKVAPLIGVKVGVKEIGVGLPRSRENMKRCWMFCCCCRAIATATTGDQHQTQHEQQREERYSRAVPAQ